MVNSFIANHVKDEGLADWEKELIASTIPATHLPPPTPAGGASIVKRARIVGRGGGRTTYMVKQAVEYQQTIGGKVLIISVDRGHSKFIMDTWVGYDGRGVHTSRVSSSGVIELEADSEIVAEIRPFYPSIMSDLFRGTGLPAGVFVDHHVVGMSLR